MRDIHTFVILAYLENDNLEECIKSVLNQTIKSNVIIATSTKNDFIIDLASEYGLGVMVNDSPSNKGRDYNYALNTFDTKLVTIAHQDDIYDRNYVKEILKSYEQNKDASIIFTDHYEILKDKKIKDNFKKKITKLLLKPLKYKRLQNKKYFKNLVLKYKQCFCTSSVTYVKNNINKEFFVTDLTYNNDWLSFINLARDESKFVYINKKLVGKRVNDKKIEEKINEDIFVYRKMWPNWLINYIYKIKEDKTIVKEE